MMWTILEALAACLFAGSLVLHIVLIVLAGNDIGPTARMELFRPLPLPGANSPKAVKWRNRIALGYLLSLALFALLMLVGTHNNAIKRAEREAKQGVPERHK